MCRRCGILRPTLRKWLRRYIEDGLEGLASRSRRLRHSPNQKVFEQEEAWILAHRRERKLGARRIQHELRRLYNCFLSLETIHTVLTRHPTPPVRRPKRYSMRLPGVRAQMDTMKLAPGLYQYTLVDDCTRFLVVAPYPRRTAAHTLEFLDHVLEQVPFSIQRLQTDNGTEFMALALRIKHRPIPPRTPHLNSKVERAQKTVRDEFYATTTLGRATLADDLEDWLQDYNERRVHGSLGVTPIDRWAVLEDGLSSWDDVIAAFDLTQEMNYVELLTLRRQYAAAWKSETVCTNLTYSHRAPTQLNDVLADAEVACLHPAAIRRQPRMLFGGVNRLGARGIGRGRLAAVRRGRHLLRLIGRAVVPRGVPILPVLVQRHVEQVVIVVDPHVLHRLRAGRARARIVRRHLVAYFEAADGPLTAGGGHRGVSGEGEARAHSANANSRIRHVGSGGVRGSLDRLGGQPGHPWPQQPAEGGERTRGGHTDARRRREGLGRARAALGALGGLVAKARPDGGEARHAEGDPAASRLGIEQSIAG